MGGYLRGGLSVDLLRCWGFNEKGREPQRPALRANNRSALTYGAIGIATTPQKRRALSLGRCDKGRAFA